MTVNSMRLERRVPGLPDETLSSLFRAFAMDERHNPFRVGLISICLPRVARSSQPWAGGRDPVGIESACETQANRQRSPLELLCSLTP